MSYPLMSEQEAIHQTANWRMYYANMYNVATGSMINYNSPEVFRGFRIPLDDLNQIMEVINQHNSNPQNQNNKINSIRAYFAKKTKNIVFGGDVHAILLPVVGGRSMVPPVQPVQSFGTDMLKYFPPQSTSPVSCIYDFTSPCPTECDTSSPLFSYNII